MKVKELMTTGSLMTLAPDDTLEVASQMLLWSTVGQLPVLVAGRVVGIFGEGDLLGRSDLSARVGGAMRPLPVAIGPQDDLAAAVAAMTCHGTSALPIVDDDLRLQGLLLVGELLRLLLARTLQRPGAIETVGTAMTRNVATAKAGDALVYAAARMRSIGVRHLPVVDGDDCLLGILSDRDLRSAVGSAELEGDEVRGRVRALRVGDVMSRDPLTVNPTAPLDEAGRILVEHKIGALPVIDDRRHIVGMLSYVDYIRATTAP
jgi:CBS domain-containing protein